MANEPAVSERTEDPSRIKTRIGIRMVLVYGALFFGFILINTIKPAVMDLEVVFGLNLAVTYGFGLILLAIVLGLVYNSICTAKEKKSGRGPGEGNAQ